MSIFNSAIDSFISTMKDYKQFLKIALPIAIFILLIYLFFSLNAQNLSLKNQFLKIADDRSYVINALDKYYPVQEILELQFDAEVINEYFASEEKLFNNFDLQISNSSILITLDFSNDFESLNQLIRKIKLIQNIEIQEVIMDPNIDSGFRIKFLLSY